ncbi:MAG: hypothetical protein JW809_04095 [Pirellulales bacterium]|nr:hypothetical protein [Pirellulales bacterium]
MRTICFSIVVALSAAGAARGTDVMRADEDNAEKRNSVYHPAAHATASPKTPIELQPGPYLFLDDYLIDKTVNVRRRVNCPARDPRIANPIVTGKEDRNFQPYMSVVRDPQTGRFRIWYCTRTDDEDPIRAHIGTMASEDGIHWRRPVRVLDDPAPIEVGCSVIDEGPGFPDPAARYKFAWHWWRPNEKSPGLRIAVSPDGLTFAPLAPRVVLSHSHDINNLFRDTLRGRYVATISVTGRRTMQSTSEDLVHWTKPWYVMLSDPSDPNETQFYAMSGYLIRGDLWIGLVKILHDNQRAEGTPEGSYGVGHTQLAWSRDGESWVRDQTPFFEPDPTPGAWDHAHAWMDCQVLVGDEVFLYYCGYKNGHKVNRFEERQIGLARMPRDRYASRDAGKNEGTLLTRPIVPRGGKITVNANVEGEMRVRLLDASCGAIAGFDAGDCRPIHGDGVALPVAWKGASLDSLGDKPVRIEFRMKEARLYGFDLAE